MKKKDPRHRAREAAVQILYQWEVGRGDVGRAAETFFAWQWPNVDPPSDELRTFATRLAHDTVDRLSAIDPLIADTAERWRPERMAVLDRLILRMAICELLRDRELGLLVDGVRVEVPQLARRAQRIGEAHQLPAQLVGLGRRTGDVHDGAGVRTGESTDHDVF